MCCNVTLLTAGLPSVPDATVPLVTGDIVEVAEVTNGFVDGVDLPVKCSAPGPTAGGGDAHGFVS